jgi:hypothetical protein
MQISSKRSVNSRARHAEVVGGQGAGERLVPRLLDFM